MTEPLRFSVLREMGRSPAHAKFKLDNPSAGQTPAMRFGTLVHAVVLGTPLPPVWDGERRGKDWAAFRDANAGKNIVTAAELEEATAIAGVIAANPEASELLSGIREKTLLWDWAGRPCRTTPDAFQPGKVHTDLKTCGNAAPKHFPWHALRHAYLAQMAWQQDAIQRSYATPERVFIVAVETREPYGLCNYQLTPAALDFGRKVYRGWIEEFLAAEKANSWPSYPLGVLDAPPEEFRLSFDEEDEVA